MTPLPPGTPPSIFQRTGELFGISYVDSFVSVWNVRLRQMQPFGEVSASKDGPTGGKYPLQARPPSQNFQSPPAVQQMIQKPDHHREYLVCCPTSLEWKNVHVNDIF